MKTFDDNFEEACRNMFQNAEFVPTPNLWNKIEKGMRGENLWEKTLRQLFEHAELTPSERVWQRIANTLHRPVIVPLWKWASAAAVALVTGSALYYYGTQPNFPEPTPNEAQYTKPLPKSSGQTLSENASIGSISSAVIPSDNYPQGNDVSQAQIESIRDTKATFLPTSQNKEILIQAGHTPSKTEIVDQQSTVILPTTERLLASPLDYPLVSLATEPQNTNWLIKPVRLGLVVEPTAEPTNISTDYAYWIGVNVAFNDFKPHFQIQPIGAINPFLNESTLAKTDIRSALLDSLQLQSATQLGFEFARKIGKVLVISVGLQRQSAQYSANVLVKQYIPQVLNSERTFNDIMTIQQTSWGIPLLIGADWQNKNGLGILVMGGLQADFGTTAQIKNEFALAQYNLGTYNSLNMSGLGKVGISYQISQHFNLGLETVYRQSLQNIYQNTALSSRPSWFSLGTSLRYRF